MMGTPGGPQPLDLQQHCDLASRVLKLVRTRLPATAGPVVRDWNDRLLVEAFARAYRCLRSVRELAVRREGDDAGVLTRALVAITLRYLWLARVDDEAERRDRLRRMLRAWATERAKLGQELLDLGHVDDTVAGGIATFRQNVEQFRAQAQAFERDGVGSMLDDKAIALRLDRDLKPDEPRFFELVYARIYRTTSDVAHYGLATALAGYPRDPNHPGRLELVRVDEQQAAEALGLALVTFAALLAFAEPVIRHGLTDEVDQLAGALVQARRRDRGG